jgi:NADH-quinone oxidoreductase subunit J
MLYWIFGLLILSSLASIFSKNPIQAVLFLILSFLLTALIFLLIGAEFLALLMIIVYVGAISILFLFIVMMLNLKIVELYNNNLVYFPVSLLLIMIFVFELVLMMLLSFDIHLNISDLSYNNLAYNILSCNNLILIGQVLYNHYLFGFLIVTIALLVSMVGSIVIIKDKKFNE